VLAFEVLLLTVVPDTLALMTTDSFKESTMQNRNFLKQVASEQRLNFEEERRKLIVQRVKLPNGATFTRFKPVTESINSDCHNYQLAHNALPRTRSQRQ